MHDQDIRSTVLVLARKGNTLRQIAKATGISRYAAKQIVQAGTAEVPATTRRRGLDAGAPRTEATICSSL